MICPKCQKDTLQGFGQVEGVDVDFCSECKGIWFDAGELAFYVEVEKDVPDLEAAIASGKPSGHFCPRCSTELVETHYVPGESLMIDVCPSCKGIFLDKGEVPRVEKLSARQGGLERVTRTVAALEKKGYMILGSSIRQH